MKKIIVLFFSLLLFTSSCSRIDLAVYFADTYVVNKADDYFDLAGDQKKWLKSALKADINKVKRIIFPQLGHELLRVADILNTNRMVDQEAVYVSYQRVKKLVYEGARIFAPNAALFSEKLSSRQIVVFQKEMDEKLIDLRKDDTEKNNYKKMKKNFETWIGHLTSEQKKSLENFVRETPSMTREKIFNRQTMSHDFVKAFPNKISRAQYVRNVFTQYEKMRNPDYSILTEAYNKRVAEFVTVFLNELRAGQRENLVSNLRDRANQLIKLSKE